MLASGLVNPHAEKVKSRRQSSAMSVKTRPLELVQPHVKRRTICFIKASDFPALARKYLQGHTVWRYITAGLEFEKERTGRRIGVRWIVCYGCLAPDFK